MPTVLIDADGCPVVNLIIRLCKGHGVAVLILCDTAHRIEREAAETLVFDKGVDSVDFVLVSEPRGRRHHAGPATMCLPHRVRVLNQNGLEYTTDNIDILVKCPGKTKSPSGPASTRRGLPGRRRSRIRHLHMYWETLLCCKPPEIDKILVFLNLYDIMNLVQSRTRIYNLLK